MFLLVECENNQFWQIFINLTRCCHSSGKKLSQVRQNYVKPVIIFSQRFQTEICANQLGRYVDALFHEGKVELFFL